MSCDRYRSENYKSPDGHLLYVRALESEGNADQAVEEYQVLSKYFPGTEAARRELG